MKTVQVKAGIPYEVCIENGLLSKCGDILEGALGRVCKAAVLTDDTVDALYGRQVEEALARSGFSVCRFAMPHGEANKNLSVWASMLDFLAESRLTRADALVALGGGVVGDMAGFAAASFLRGIPFMQIPTTLLAMVDSSVGGKTGLNLKAGKNLAGAFYQPCAVVCDPATLRTLPQEIFADGVAEIIKYGVLGDESFFKRLKDGHWHDGMLDVIQACVEAKAKLVEADEHDTGSRQFLNLGHTLGHAIEKCSGFSVSHGHAVAVGMVYAARLSHRLGLCDNVVLESITQALTANHLPISAPYTAGQLCEVALSDKKRAGGRITFVLPRDIGRCELVQKSVSEMPELVRLAVNA